MTARSRVLARGSRVVASFRILGLHPPQRSPFHHLSPQSGSGRVTLPLRRPLEKSTSFIHLGHNSTSPLQVHHHQLLPGPFCPASQRRAFSIVASTNEALIALHTATGLPWFVVLPLFGLAVNLVARLPPRLYVRRLEWRQSRLAPLFIAAGGRAFRDVLYRPREKNMPRLPPEQEKKLRQDEATRVSQTTVKKLYRDWGVQEWKKRAAILGLPGWLAGVEVVRSLCGANTGLWGLLAGSSQGEGDGGGEGKASAQPASAPAPAPAPTVGPAPSLESLLQEHPEGTPLPGSLEAFLAEHGQTLDQSADAASSAVAYAGDPSLATGGCLWFPDLTVADPLHILPVALSVVMLMNVLPKTWEGTKRLFNIGGQEPVSRTQTRTRDAVWRVVVVGAALVGPLTMSFPAAIHIYWISTSSAWYALNMLVGRLMPLANLRGDSLKPCGRDRTICLHPTREEQKQGETRPPSSPPPPPPPPRTTKRMVQPDQQGQVRVSPAKEEREGVKRPSEAHEKEAGREKPRNTRWART